MKKIYTFILTGAAILVLAACNKDLQIEDNSQINGPVYETLSVKVGAETKVVLDNTNKSVFEKGDKIAVWTEAGSFQNCPVDAEGKITVDISGGVRSNYAVYYTGAAPTFESSTLKITLPDTYDYEDVAGDKNPVPMVAVNNASDATNDMVFYAVCALARITLTGIPANANKLLASFSHDVTGEFTVTNPGTAAPSISAAERTSKNVITINITPGTDYTGAVINLPVPVGAGISIHIDAYNGSDKLQGQTLVVNDWSAARAHGKKATCAFTPSMNSMILAPGNLYTDNSGDLHMAANYYEHIYAFSSNDDYANDGEKYNAAKRTHFNYNEVYNLMSGNALNNTVAYTNIGSYETPAVTRNDITGGGGMTWRVPSRKEWASLYSDARPGAKVRNGDGDYSSGWKFVKVLVSGMGTAGTSKYDGTAYSGNSDFQAGLLLFPDNVEITGHFDKLGAQNTTGAAYNTTTITKSYLDDLITSGCVFLPAAGHWNGSFSSVGISGFYCSCVQKDDNIGYAMAYNKSNVTSSSNIEKSGAFVSVRLVRDIIEP